MTELLELLELRVPLHVQLACQSVMMNIMAMRDFCPSQDFCGEKIGEDCCEELFRESGGHGKIKSNARNYSAAGCKRIMERVGLVQIGSVGPNGIKIRKRGKTEIRSKDIEDMELPDADKKCLTMTNARIINAINEGIATACANMLPFDIKPERAGGIIPNDIYDAPWINESASMKMMRKAEASDDGMVVDYPEYLNELIEIMR